MEFPCIFCQKLKYNENLSYRDEQVFAFLDIKPASAQDHVLICSNEHIPNTDFLNRSHIDLILHMKEQGKKLLQNFYPDEEYRFGFHEPPVNSINHLHLHGFVLPFQNEYYEKNIYGELLTRVELMVTKIYDRPEKTFVNTNPIFHSRQTQPLNYPTNHLNKPFVSYGLRP